MCAAPHVIGKVILKCYFQMPAGRLFAQTAFIHRPNMKPASESCGMPLNGNEWCDLAFESIRGGAVIGGGSGGAHTSTRHERGGSVEDCAPPMGTSGGELRERKAIGSVGGW